MKFLINKKTIAIIIIAILLLSGVYFTLGGFGRSGPDAAPNLAEYGLVGYWNMEEGKGQTVYDRSGNSNNGALGASTAVGKDDPVFTSGYSSAGAGGTALKFDGKDDYVDAGNAASLQLASAFTFEAWVYPKTPTVGGSVISKQTSSSGTGTGFSIIIAWGEGRAWFTVYDGSGNQQTTNSIKGLTANNWYHVVGLYDGSQIVVYLNGVAGTPIAITGFSPSNAQNLTIGKYSYTAGPFFSGSIDEVRIYNRALSADEIRQHYNQKKPILEWKFDEGSGTTIRDESFNNYDGTLHE